MKLIGLYGCTQVEKDTTFIEIEKLLKDKTVKRLAFSDKLKIEVETMLESVRCNVDFSYEEDVQKFKTMLVAWDKQMRKFIPTCWIDAVEKEIMRQKSKRNGVEYLVITDVKRIDEIDMIQKHGGQVVRLERQGYKPANEEEKLSSYLISRDYPNLPVVHNDGTSEGLARKVLEVVR